MEFITYTVEGNPDKTVVTVSNIAGAAVLGALFTGMIGLMTIATVLFVTAVVIGVVLALFKKGNIQAIVLSQNKLIITTTRIKIADTVYEMEKIITPAYTTTSSPYGNW